MGRRALRYVDVRVSNGVGIVEFRFHRLHSAGDMDMIAEELNAIARRDDVRDIVLNCGALDYFPSGFLGILADLSRRLREGGRRLAICRMRPEPLRALAVTRLDTIIPAYATEEEAIQAMNARRRSDEQGSPGPAP